MDRELTPEQLEEARFKAARELKRRYDTEYIRYFAPYAYQQPYVHSNAWIDAVIGGNRSGKTMTSAYKFACLVLGEAGIKKYGLPRISDYYPKAPFVAWVVSVDFTQSRDVTQPMLLNMIPDNEIAEIKRRERGAIDFIRLKSGVMIHFKSCDSGWRKFQGSKVAIIWFDEEPDEDVFKECAMRIGDQRMKIMISMTPLMGMTWLVDTLYDGSLADTKIFEYFTQDNQALSPDDLEKLKKLYPQDEWQTRFMGKPLEKHGLIYPEFKTGIHVYRADIELEDIFSKLDWFFWIDYGSALPTCIYLVAADDNGNILVHDEHYLADAAITDHADVAKLMYDSVTVRTAEQKRACKYKFMMTIIDPSTKDGEKRTGKSVRLKFLEAFRDRKIKTAIMPGNNDVDLGIEVVKGLLRPDMHHFDPFTQEPNAPSLYINERCHKAIWEIRRYRRHAMRRGGAETDKPRKKDDHAMDAFRYGCVHLAGYKGGKNTVRKKKRRYNKTTGY